MEFHGVDAKTQFKRMRELAPEAYKAFLEFDAKAFKDGVIPGKTKELIALGIAPETTFVAMAMAAGAAWSHGGLALQCLQEHKR